MSDKPSERNIFALYTTKKGPETQGKLTYYAYGGSSDPTIKESWFRVHYADRSIEMLPYTTLRKVLCFSESRVILQCEDMTLTLEGRNLSGLLSLIQDVNLRAIYPFDPEQFDERPAEEPVITRILREPARAAEEAVTAE